MAHLHHTIDYVELSVSDLTSAKAFYEKAFGWQFNDYGDAYAGIRDASGEEVGGLGVGNQPGPGGVLVLVYSDDLEASQASVEAAGGHLDEAIYEFPGGRRFIFFDDSGNRLGVFTYS